MRRVSAAALLTRLALDRPPLPPSDLGAVAILALSGLPAVLVPEGPSPLPDPALILARLHPLTARGPAGPETVLPIAPEFPLLALPAVRVPEHPAALLDPVPVEPAQRAVAVRPQDRVRA